MDPLERKILQDRAALDKIEEPEIEAMWDGVRQGLDQSKSFRIGRWWSAAAAVAILAIGLNLYLLWERTEVDTAVLSLSDMSPELAQQEKKFQTLIAEKEASLKLSELSGEEFRSLIRELEILENVNEEYRRELPAHGSNERLINTLIKYYELKILILEQLENEIIKKRYNESPGPVY